MEHVPRCNVSHPLHVGTVVEPEDVIEFRVSDMRFHLVC